MLLAATPIGEVEDASPRLRRWLAEADVVAAEDTRRLHRLLGSLGVEPRGRVVAHHEHNESASAAELVRLMGQGAVVLLVTDAGMPSVSDPGYRLVRAAVEAGVVVSCLPGPSAVLAAVAVSGLASDRFCFEGFAPRRAGERARALRALAAEPRTMVFFEAPHRLEALLRAMVDEFGPHRSAVVCRELTKTHEEVLRGGLEQLLDWAQDHQVLGEITVVVAGASPQPPSLAELVELVQDRTAQGERLKDAVSAVAAGSGVAKRELYDAALAARDR